MNVLYFTIIIHFLLLKLKSGPENRQFIPGYPAFLVQVLLEPYCCTPGHNMACSGFRRVRPTLAHRRPGQGPCVSFQAYHGRRVHVCNYATCRPGQRFMALAALCDGIRSLVEGQGPGTTPYLGGVGVDPVFLPPSTLFNPALMASDWYNTSTGRLGGHQPERSALWVYSHRAGG